MIIAFRNPRAPQLLSERLASAPNLESPFHRPTHSASGNLPLWARQARQHVLRGFSAVFDGFYRLAQRGLRQAVASPWWTSDSSTPNHSQFRPEMSADLAVAE